MKALVIGATGATGKELLDVLLSDGEFKQVDVFVRRELSIKSDKLNVNIIDFDKPEQWQNSVKGDVLFSCLGTTLKAAGSKEAQWKIDYDYQYAFAKAAKENGVKNYVLVSSVSASTKSPFFYNKMKGQLEEDIVELGFEKTIILKPPILVRKNSDRKMEVWAVKVIKFFNALGMFKSQKPLATENLAIAMVNALKKLNNGIHALSPGEISKFVND